MLTRTISLVEENARELNASLRSGSEKTEAMGDTLGQTIQGVDKIKLEVTNLKEEMEDRISSKDWEQIEADLLETFTTKAQVGTIVEVGPGINWPNKLYSHQEKLTRNNYARIPY